MSTEIALKRGTPPKLPRYLCERHRAHAVVNPQQACGQWLRLMETGNQAYANGNLELANQSFGAASEIASLLIASPMIYPGRMNAAERLMTATHNLSVTLAKQNRHPLAGHLLIRIHRELLMICNDSTRPADSRAAAFSCLTPSLRRIRPFLERSKNQQMAQQLTSLTEEINRKAKTQICH